MVDREETVVKHTCMYIWMHGGTIGKKKIKSHVRRPETPHRPLPHGLKRKIYVHKAKGPAIQ